MKRKLVFLLNCIHESWKGWCGLLVMGTADIGLALSIIGITKHLIDAASEGLSGVLWERLLLMLLCMVISILLRGFSSRLTVWLQNDLRNKLMKHYYSILLREDWSSMKMNHSGDLMARMNQDVDGVVHLSMISIPQFILTSLKLCGAFIYLYIMDSILAFVLLSLVPFVLLSSKFYYSKMSRLSRLLKEQWSGVLRFFQETIQNREILKVLMAEPVCSEKLAELQGSFMQTVKLQSRFSFSSNVAVMLGFSIGYLITFSWGVYRLENGALTFGSLMAFLQLVNMIQGPSLGLAQLLPGVVSSFVAIERLNELGDLPSEKSEPCCLLSGIKCIRFRHVSFRYHENAPLLEGLNWHFEFGKMYALTGRTGCGKTTVIRLLLAFIRPDKGNIWIENDFMYKNIGVDTRINFAYVSQDCSLFSGSIRDNLRMRGVTVSDEEMVSALKQAEADFVFDLPEGMDTLINERGGGLSGGQVQRLAIAGALLSPGNILLFDEFTSALDDATESEIIASLKKQVKDKMIVIISHKQKVIEACDCVYRL